MTLIITLLARWGLSEGLAKKLAPIAALIGVFAILGVLWGAVKVWDHFDDKAAIERDRIEANNTALEAQLKAAEASAKEALRNAETNRETKEAFDDAIYNPQLGDSPDPDVRLACEQLRRDGQDTTAISECGER